MDFVNLSFDFILLFSVRCEIAKYPSFVIFTCRFQHEGLFETNGLFKQVAEREEKKAIEQCLEIYRACGF